MAPFQGLTENGFRFQNPGRWSAIVIGGPSAWAELERPFGAGKSHQAGIMRGSGEKLGLAVGPEMEIELPGSQLRVISGQREVLPQVHAEVA
jgi:hypothetical protein